MSWASLLPYWMRSGPRRDIFGQPMRPLPPPWECPSCELKHRIATCADMRDAVADRR